MVRKVRLLGQIICTVLTVNTIKRPKSGADYWLIIQSFTLCDTQK